jgi:hypothetical protein
MQERQATVVRVRRMRGRMVEADIEERLERQLWDWKGNCIACHARGESALHAMREGNGAGM